MFRLLAKRDPPFRLSEEGWGEFEMQLIMSPVGKGADQVVAHDLNFSVARYEAVHDLVREIWDR